MEIPDAQTVFNGSVAAGVVGWVLYQLFPRLWGVEDKQEKRDEEREKRYQQQVDIASGEVRALLRESLGTIGAFNSNAESSHKKQDMTINILSDIKVAFDTLIVKSEYQIKQQEMLDELNNQRFESLRQSVNELNHAKQIRESAERVKKKRQVSEVLA